MGVRITRVGDWDKAVRICREAPHLIKKAKTQALLQEAHFFRGKLWRGFRDQAPGGKEFKPLALTTIAVRRFLGFKGRKALIKHADLMNSLAVTRDGDDVFVGIHRRAVDKSGRSLVRIAELNEEGSRPIVIKVTPKMRRFLHAAFQAYGPTRRAQVVSKTAKLAGIIIVQIPPRPVFKPVWEAHSPQIRDRVFARMRQLLRGTLAK